MSLPYNQILEASRQEMILGQSKSKDMIWGDRKGLKLASSTMGSILAENVAIVFDAYEKLHETDLQASQIVLPSRVFPELTLVMNPPAVVNYDKHKKITGRYGALGLWTVRDSVVMPHDSVKPQSLRTVTTGGWLRGLRHYWGEPVDSAAAEVKRANDAIKYSLNCVMLRGELEPQVTEQTEATKRLLEASN